MSVPSIATALKLADASAWAWGALGAKEAEQDYAVVRKARAQAVRRALGGASLRAIARGSCTVYTRRSSIIRRSTSRRIPARQHRGQEMLLW